MPTLQSQVMTWAVSHLIRVFKFNYGKVRTHASCETARTWESFDHQGLEYPPYRRATVQV